MQVSVAHRPPNTAVLTLRGSLDIDTAPSLKANLGRGGELSGADELRLQRRVLHSE